MNTTIEVTILRHPTFGDIRTIYDKNGTILFCAKDVARALGYGNTSEVIARHCKNVVKIITLNNGSRQTIPYIYEPDLYRLLEKCKSQLAVNVEQWLFKTVVPTLGQNAKVENTGKTELMTNPDFLMELGKLGEQLKQEQQEKEALLLEVHKLKQLLSEYSPQLNYLDHILNSCSTLTTTQIAADYGISARKLNNILHQERVQRKVGSQWILYSEYNHNFTSSETNLSDDEEHSAVHTKWTQMGRLLIHNILIARGFEPI